MQTLNGYAAEILCELPACARPLCILGGGALRAFYDGTTPKDYDIFFRSYEDFVVVMDLLIFVLNWPLDSTSPLQAPSFTAPSGHVFNLIGFAYAGPEEQASRFDFRCCQMVAWADTYGAINVHLCEGAEDDAKAKVLTVMNNNGTDRTIGRIQRYVEKYGYTVAFDEVDQESIEEGNDNGGCPATFDIYALKIRRYVERFPVHRSGYSG